MSKSKILFQLSGSIACYKSCFAISRLVQEGFEIQTVCTESALKFVGAATFEGLTGRPVFSDVFEYGRMMDHIQLAKWADLSILCPATANQITQLASGQASDCIGTLFLAYDLKTKPYFVAPAMNQQMFQHPAVQNALATLEGWKVRILPTEHGHLACGDYGEGRLLEPIKIVEEIKQALS